MRRLISGALGLCFLLSLSLSSAEAAVSIKSSALVNGCEVMADCLVRKDEISQSLKKELSNIRIGYISEPFGTLTIDRSLLERKLASVAEPVIIPESVVVKRSGDILHGETVTETIRRSCAERIEGEFNLDASKIPGTIILPGSILSYTVETGSENKLGMKLYTLKAETENGPFRQIFQVTVTKSVDAAKLTRLAKAGEVITPDMVTKEPVILKSDIAKVPITYDQVLGKVLERFKSAGTIVRQSDLSDDPARSYGKKSLSVSSIEPIREKSSAVKPSKELLIKSGDAVDFIVSTGSLSVAVPAKAIQAGGAGDEISLINLQTKKRIRGIVTDKGVVTYERH